jgi:intracellular sulfur oxidation DsrE/DsrF family protein
MQSALFWRYSVKPFNITHSVRAILWAVTLAVSPTLTQAQVDDRAALAGLKEAKVAFDLTAGDGKALLARLNVIDETRVSLLKQGVQPSFVLTFRGPATLLVQTDLNKTKPEHRADAQAIAAKLSEMSQAQGVQSLEQCSVAIRQQETKAENVLPQIKVIGNSWISLIAYQAKGFAYIQP